jgi:hypothetical protein
MTDIDGRDEDSELPDADDIAREQRLKELRTGKKAQKYHTHEDTGMTGNAMREEARLAGEARRIDALSHDHVLKSSDAWKNQKKLWNKASHTQRQNWLYAMVLFDGVCANTRRGIKLIAQYFDVTPKEVEVYRDVLDMADAARVLKINRNQLGTSLGRDDQINLKFFMGKQFAYQVTDPAHEGVESVDEGKDISITVVTREQHEQAQAASTTTAVQEPDQPEEISPTSYRMN